MTRSDRLLVGDVLAVLRTGLLAASAGVGAVFVAPGPERTLAIVMLVLGVSGTLLSSVSNLLRESPTERKRRLREGGEVRPAAPAPPAGGAA